MSRSDKYLTADFYSDEALGVGFKSVVDDLKTSISNKETVISIALINQLLPVGYNRAKQFFLKLKNEGYLDQKGRLLFDAPAADNKKESSDNKCIIKSVHDLCTDKEFCNISQLIASQNDSPFISSGFPKIDKLIHGFEKGKLYMIAGRPGCGKSVLALNIALNIASNPFVEKSVLYVSTDKDMSAQVFSSRLISNLCNVSIDEIKKDKNLSLENREILLKKLKQFRNDNTNGNALSKLYFSFMERVDIASIKDTISCLNKSERGISCLIVDPVFLYPTPPGLYKRNLAALKELALRLNIPVILSSLTTKAAEQRVNSEWEHPAKQKPILEDICFSELVSEYVDVVLLMDRRTYKQLGCDDLKSKVELKIYRDDKREGRRMHFRFCGDYVSVV